jgi:hypothetical protein
MQCIDLTDKFTFIGLLQVASHVQEKLVLGLFYLLEL